MVAVELALIVVAFAVDVHEIEFVDEAVALEELEGAVDGAAVDAGIEFLGFAKKLSSVEMLRGGFHDAQDGAALLGHADSALGEVGLQAAGHLGLR